VYDAHGLIPNLFRIIAPVRLAKPGLALSSGCVSLIPDELPVEFREFFIPDAEHFLLARRALQGASSNSNAKQMFQKKYLALRRLPFMVN
jgi:hypothetical protein